MPSPGVGIRGGRPRAPSPDIGCTMRTSVRFGASRARLARHGGRPLAHPLGGPRGRRRPRHRRDPASAHARRIHRPARGQGQPVGAAHGGAGQGRGRRPRPPVRPAGSRQDDPRHDHRARARGQRQVRLGAGHRARRRPRRDPHLARGARRPVHRRDPPPQPGGRGDPLSGDGGLRAGRDDRQGPLGPVAAPQPQAVHGRRRHHPGGTDQQPAARPVRGDLPARLLHGARAGRDRRPLGGDPRRRDRAGGDQGHRPAGSRHAAHRQPPPQARPRPRPGPRRRPRRRGDRHGGHARDGDRRRGPRLDRSQAPRRDRPEVRVRTRRRGRPGRGPVRGDRDHRGRLRAVPAPARLHRPHAAGPDRHGPGAGAPVRARLRDPAAARLGPRHGRPVGPAGGRRPAVDRGPRGPARPRTRDGPIPGTRVTLRGGRPAAGGRLDAGTDRALDADPRRRRDPAVHAGRHERDGQGARPRTTSARPAPRSSSPTRTTCTCGPGTSGSRASAACIGSWTGTARS